MDATIKHMEFSSGPQGEVLQKGEAFYLGTLKNTLESEHMGEYVAIDVDTNEYLVDAEKSNAIKRAQEKFGQKLFYIVQVGGLEEPTINFRERKNVAWIFSR
jgi:hypothetical protein